MTESKTNDSFGYGQTIKQQLDNRLVSSHERWLQFLEEKTKVNESGISPIDNLDIKSFRAIAISNPPDIGILKEIYHETSDELKLGMRIMEYLITGFGDNMLYEELVRMDVIKLTDIVKQIHRAFYLEGCNIKVPAINLKNLKGDRDFKIRMFRHVGEDQLGKIEDMGLRMGGISNGDYLFMTHIFAFNAIYGNGNEGGKDRNIGYRKYIDGRGYLGLIKSAILRYRDDLFEYLKDLEPYLEEAMLREKLEWEYNLREGREGDSGIPDSVKVEFPSGENIKEMERMIGDVRKIIGGNS